MAPGVNDPAANKVRIARLVGSAIAWKTSLLDFIVQLFDCEYTCSHLTAQIYFLTERALCAVIASIWIISHSSKGYRDNLFPMGI